MDQSGAKQNLMIAKQQLDKLSLFIVNLAKFFAGTSSKIDTELSVIIKLLSGKPDYAKAAEVSVSISESLKSEAKYLRQQQLSSLSQIESSLRHLNEIDAIDASVKTEIKAFLSTLETEKLGSIRVIEIALMLFRKALVHNTVSSNAQNDKMLRDMQTQITLELKQLLAPHFNKKPADNHVAELQQKLSSGLSIQELLECCISLIRFITRDIITQAGAANQLIDDIHHSLSKVNQGLKTTIEQSRSRRQKRAQQNAKMQLQINAMETVISDTHELGDLKLQTQQYLTRLQASINQSESEDKHEQEQMLVLLQSMQKRLTELEHRAMGYKQQLEVQRKEALTDSLTKLPNRLAYEERAAQVLSDDSQHIPCACMAIVDIDHFKSINDKYGHSVGDKTLQVIANQFSKNLLSSDFVARWGGEEFVVLMPSTSLDDAFARIEGLRNKISQLPFMFKGNRVSVTISAGLIVFNRNQSLSSAFENADALLYKAKAGGRNQTQIKGT